MSEMIDSGDGSTGARAHVTVAHRGVSGLHADNTVAAFEAAIAAGHGIETDVRRTRDGVLVLVHHREVNGGLVEELDAAQLLEANPGVVTLRWLLERCQGDEVLLDLEVKYLGLSTPHGPIEQAVLDELERVGRLGRDAEGSTVVSSFSPGCLLQFLQLAPALPRVQIFEGRPVPAASLGDLLDIVRSYACAVAPDVGDLTAIPWVEEAHRRGLGVLPYAPSTIVTREQNLAAVQAALRAGCDGGIYNHPGMAARLSRGGALPASQAMRRFLAARREAEPVTAPGPATVGRLTALLLASGDGRSLSAADLRAAATYAANDTIARLLAERE